MRSREAKMLVTTRVPPTFSNTSIGARPCAASAQTSAVTSWSGETSSATVNTSSGYRLR